MADPPLYPDSREHTGGDTGTARWAKVFWIIAILVLVLLFGIKMFVPAAGGGHGLGDYTPSGGGSGDTSTASAIESGGLGGHDTSEWGH